MNYYIIQPKGVSRVKKEVEIFTDSIPVDKEKKYLDMGTGSGFITILLSKKGLVCDAADISESAIKTASENFKKNKVDANLFLSDFFSNIDGKYDYIIFNAPVGTTSNSSFKNYIKSFLREIKIIRKIFLQFGLHFFIKSRAIINIKFIKKSLPHLNKDGSLFLLLYKAETGILEKKFPKLNFRYINCARLKKINNHMVISEVK